MKIYTIKNNSRCRIVEKDGKFHPEKYKKTCMFFFGRWKPICWSRKYGKNEPIIEDDLQSARKIVDRYMELFKPVQIEEID